jgi:solute carrier family 34 (sodium-dependent phosphate cotransporter)
MASPQFKLFKRFTNNIDEKQPVFMTFLVTFLRVCMVMGVLYCFFISIGLMGSGFKIFGKDFAKTLIETTNNPFVGLFIGILATAVIQSSSTTTSMVVAFVASGTITVQNAIPVIMGANVGTAVTSAIVALGHMTRKQEFERAFGAAIVHDMFNIMTVVIFLPIELYTGFLHTAASNLSAFLSGTSGVEFQSPLKLITKPVVKFITSQLASISSNQLISAIIVVIVGISLLFFSLYLFTKLLKIFVLTKFQNLLEASLYKSGYIAMVVGLVFTAVVQSSSITTSLMIPMAAAGIITVHHIFPVALGANVGTTVTALLASLATGSPEGLTIALVHLLFNACGILTFYPIPELRKIPIIAAQLLARKSAQNRLYAVMFILVVFFIIPGIAIFFT